MSLTAAEIAQPVKALSVSITLYSVLALPSRASIAWFYSLATFQTSYWLPYYLLFVVIIIIVCVCVSKRTMILRSKDHLQKAVLSLPPRGFQEFNSSYQVVSLKDKLYPRSACSDYLGVCVNVFLQQVLFGCCDFFKPPSLLSNLRLQTNNGKVRLHGKTGKIQEYGKKNEPLTRSLVEASHQLRVKISA